MVRRRRDKYFVAIALLAPHWKFCGSTYDVDVKRGTPPREVYDLVRGKMLETFDLREDDTVTLSYHVERVR